MRRRPPISRKEDEAAMRVGGAAIGMLAGLVIGLITAGLFVAAGAEFAAGWAFFACIAFGAVAGYASSAAGIGLAEGVAHFIVGVIHGVAEQIQSPSNRVPWWLGWLFVAGVLFGLAILVTARW